MKLKTKKELENFLNSRDIYIDYLIVKLNEYGVMYQICWFKYKCLKIKNKQKISK